LSRGEKNRGIKENRRRRGLKELVQGGRSVVEKPAWKRVLGGGKEEENVCLQRANLNLTCAGKQKGGSLGKGKAGDLAGLRKGTASQWSDKCAKRPSKRNVEEKI